MILKGDYVHVRNLNGTLIPNRDGTRARIFRAVEDERGGLVLLHDGVLGKNLGVSVEDVVPMHDRQREHPVTLV